MIATMPEPTIERQPVVLGTLFVPLLPVVADRSSIERWESWLRWAYRVAAFRDADMAMGRFMPIDRPCRLVAMVRIADSRRYCVTDASVARWRLGIEQVAIRTGLVQESLLRGVEALFEPLDGVDLMRQPIVTGTEFNFIESGE